MVSTPISYTSAKSMAMANLQILNESNIVHSHERTYAMMKVKKVGKRMDETSRVEVQ
jgi:hypothetical protein